MDDWKTAGRYLPQHPLPEEIKEMKRDDTVCQFCGVSYLIHNEIKSLQKELDECKKEVERLRNYDEREKALIDQVNTLNMKLKDLLDKRQFEEKKCLEYEDLLFERNVSISHLKNSLSKYCEELEVEKKNNLILQEKLDTLKAIVLKVSESRSELKSHCNETSLFYRESLLKFSEESNKQTAFAFDRVSSISNFYTNSQKEVLDLQNKLKLTDDNCGKQKNVIATLSKYLIDYQEKIGLLANKFNQFEEKQLNSIKKYQHRINFLIQKVGKLKNFIKSNQSKKSSSSDQYKQENTQLKEERTRIVNAHQHQIKQLNDSFKQKLLDADNYSENLDVELKKLLVKFDAEKRLLLEANTESLNKSATESKLKYKQLNDSYEKCKREMKKLDEKLKFQQKKFADEKTQLLQEITASYEKATAETESRYCQMNEEKATHLKTIKKLEQHLESMQVKFHEEMLKQVEQHEKEKRSMEYHLSELSKQLEAKQSMEKHITTNKEKVQLQRTIEELQTSLENVHQSLKEKLYSIEEYENEVTTLRDCIQRECEERYELTEALAEARMELLSQQRFSKQSLTSAQSGVYKSRNSSHSRKLDGISDSHERLEKLKELSTSATSVNKNSMINLPSSAGKSRSSIKNLNSSASSTSRHTKNKLLISLKNR